MPKPREPWNIRPAKKRPAIPAFIKAAVEAKAAELIEEVLRAKYVLPPQVNQQFNYITNLEAKWYRNYFYFTATYACPSPHAISPSFEIKFARLEYLADEKFAMYFMRHNGESVGIYDRFSVDECMRAIRDDPCFQF